MWVLKEIKRLKISKTLIFILTDDAEFNDEKILKLAWIENQIVVLSIFDYLRSKYGKKHKLKYNKRKKLFLIK